MIATIKEQDYFLKFCYTCKIAKDLRVYHCPECGVCILRHDHHCPWLSTCIGLNNHKLLGTGTFHVCKRFTLRVVSSDNLNSCSSG